LFQKTAQIARSSGDERPYREARDTALSCLRCGDPRSGDACDPQALVLRCALRLNLSQERSMRISRHSPVLVAAALAACSSSPLPAAPDLAAPPPDLAAPPGAHDLSSPSPPIDLAAHMGKVFCGSAICDAPQVCCYTQGPGGGLSVTAACVAPGTCADGGISGSCDGPADCASSMPACCVDITLTGTSQIAGAAMCTPEAACKGMGSQDKASGQTMLTTQLCYSDGVARAIRASPSVSRYPSTTAARGWASRSTSVRPPRRWR
jgi:hypothetical protein